MTGNSGEGVIIWAAGPIVGAGSSEIWIENDKQTTPPPHEWETCLLINSGINPRLPVTVACFSCKYCHCSPLLLYHL